MSMAKRVSSVSCIKRLLISSNLLRSSNPNHRHFIATTILSFEGGDPIPERPLRGDRPRPPPPNNRSDRYSSGGRDRPIFDKDDGYGRRSPRGGGDGGGRPQFLNGPPRGGGHTYNGDGGRGGSRYGSQPRQRDDGAQRPRQPTTLNSPFADRSHNKLSDRPTPIAKEGDAFLKKFKLGFEGKDSDNPQQGDPSRVQPPHKEAPPPPQDADDIFKKMKETGLIPNAVAMLDGLCKDGLVQDAMKLFGLMREKGTIPEVVIYTAVVDGFCKAHKFDDAKRIFRKMQNNGITPNAFSYTVLIQGLCSGRSFEDAVDFGVEMLEAGHSPNVATFTNLIDGFCNDKGVEEAEKIIKRLREKGYFVNDKAVREHLDKKGPFSPLVWEAVFGKKTSQRLF